MPSKKIALYGVVLLIPFAVYFSGQFQKTPTPQIEAKSTDLKAPVTQKSDSGATPSKVDKYKDEYVIFFAGNMVEPTTQKLFFQNHPQLRYLGEGNFPGVVVVKIEDKVEETLEYLKGKDYIDLVIKNQDGLDCHTN